MTPKSDALKTFTVRLPENLYRSAKVLAGRRRQSMNHFIRESLERALREEQERGLEQAFALLARSPDECDVEFAFEAQSEVVRRDDA